MESAILDDENVMRVGLSHAKILAPLQGVIVNGHFSDYLVGYGWRLLRCSILPTFF